MAYYYYPLSTRDFAFENIFSSESVSPAIYYAKRAFGFDYFPVLPGVNHEQTIILFSEPPVYQDENNAKFILQIAEAAINHDELTFLEEGLFAYNGTIYFEREYLSILFFSPKDLKVTILKADTSLPTKATEKYASSFKIINESDCKNFPIIRTKAINTNEDITLKVALDKRYNHLKGFIYGLVIGQIANERKEEFGLKVRYQEITNAFAELKSRLDDQGMVKSKSESARGIHFYIDKLFHALEVAEQEQYQMAIGDKVEEEILLEYLLGKQSRLKSKQDLAKYLDYLIVTDQLLGKSDYKKIVDGYIRDQSPSKGIFYDLKKNVEQFIRIYQLEANSNYQAEELNNRIKQQLRNATEAFLEEISTRSFSLSTDLNGISYDFITNKVILNTGQTYLNTKTDNEFTFIINGILKFAKSNKGPAQREMILKIVEEIGNNYNKRGKDTLLYQYLDNKIDVYSLDNASNLVMKNFVAFIFNPDSLEKLDNFLISKEVEERWMAFSFWGAYNGFANISRNYTRDIFNSNNLKLQNYIDSYLKGYLNTLTERKLKIPNLEISENVSIVQTVTSDIIEENPLIKFFNLYVSGTYQLSINEFSEILKLTHQKDFQDELKLKYRISKKDSLKLFTVIKKYLYSDGLFRTD